MNKMSVAEFAEHTGWNKEKIQNLLREKELPTIKIKRRVFILVDEVPEHIQECYGALSVVAWKRKIPLLPVKQLAIVFTNRNVPSCGLIRKQKYYRREDILSKLKGKLDPYERIIVEALDQ